MIHPWCVVQAPQKTQGFGDSEELTGVWVSVRWERGKCLGLELTWELLRPGLGSLPPTRWGLFGQDRAKNQERLERIDLDTRFEFDIKEQFPALHQRNLTN